MATNDDFLVQVWKQQLDTGLRVMEALVEGVTRLREMQLEAAARAHADLEATRKSMAAATDIVRLLELQAEWARANAQRCAEYWRGLYDVAARTQADIAGSVVPRFRLRPQLPPRRPTHPRRPCSTCSTRRTSSGSTPRSSSTGCRRCRCPRRRSPRRDPRHERKGSPLRRVGPREARPGHEHPRRRGARDARSQGAHRGAGEVLGRAHGDQLGRGRWRRRSSSRTASRTWARRWCARWRPRPRRSPATAPPPRRCSPRDRERGHEVRRRGHEPDGLEARHRPGGRGAGRRARAHGEALRDAQGDRAGRRASRRTTTARSAR